MRGVNGGTTNSSRTSANTVRNTTRIRIRRGSSDSRKPRGHSIISIVSGGIINNNIININNIIITTIKSSTGN